MLGFCVWLPDVLPELLPVLPEVLLPEEAPGSVLVPELLPVPVDPEEPAPVLGEVTALLPVSLPGVPLVSLDCASALALRAVEAMNASMRLVFIVILLVAAGKGPHAGFKREHGGGRGGSPAMCGFESNFSSKREKPPGGGFEEVLQLFV